MASLLHSRNYSILVLLGQRLAGGQNKVNLLEEISLADVIPRRSHLEEFGVGGVGCQLLLDARRVVCCFFLFALCSADAAEEIGNAR